MRKGEIYYVCLGDLTEIGSEQRSGRPAVVVSNDACNEHSGVVEVVYLTTQEKPELPTHVTVYSTGRKSTALCEQINSVSKRRIGEYIGCCTVDEMHKLDSALMISLGIEIDSQNQDWDSDCVIDEDEAEFDSYVTKLEVERDTYRNLYNDLLEKLIGR